MESGLALSLPLTLTSSVSEGKAKICWDRPHDIVFSIGIGIDIDTYIWEDKNILYSIHWATAAIWKHY